MKTKLIITAALVATILLMSGCGRKMRTATDVTPGNPVERELNWQYGANDIRIQTTKLTGQLMDRWYLRTGFRGPDAVKPRVVITDIDNRTDMYVSTDIIRDIFEGAAVEDGRFTVVVGDTANEGELDDFMDKIRHDAKYANSSRLKATGAIAPQFLGKIRLTKAVTKQPRYDIEDYRMTMTLYDLETQEVVDSAWDVLRKKVSL